MRSRFARAGVIAAEALGLFVAASLAVFAFFIWRAQTSATDLRWAAPIIRAAANAAIADNAIKSIDGVTLSRAGESGGYRLLLENVAIGEQSDPAKALLPSVDIILHPQDFASGKAGPRRILVDGARLQVLRKAD
ncbi:MAG: hypothetical protein AB7V02_10805, partial [Parvularculaceae bacterium]